VTIFAEGTQTEEAGPEAVLIEVENSHEIVGSFTRKEDPAYSGGAGMYLYQTKEEECSFTVSFTVEHEAEYDIQMLSTSGAVAHLSKFSWKIDDGEYQAYGGVAGGNGGYSMDPFGQAVTWRKLKTMTLEAGEHTLTVYADKLRTLAKDFMYVYVDCVYLVPSSWEWEPYMTLKPYNIEKMKFEFVGGKITTQTVKQEEPFKVSVMNKALETTPYSAALYTELRYKGQEVANVTHVPSVSMNKWRVGKVYTDTCTIAAPFSAPDGLYEVWTGLSNIPYASGEAMYKVGEVIVGEIPQDPVPITAEISNLQIPQMVVRGEEFEVTAAYLSNTKFKETTAYLAFYKGEELWYVAEHKEKLSLTANQKPEKTFQFSIDEDVPDGDYEVEFGIHYLNNVCERVPVTIQGGTFVGERTYKPLSYGKYRPQKTGKCHFWYVNQYHALIWDGEPYIPVGGMVTPWYIITGSEVPNKDNWNKDVELYKTLQKEEIKHIYINSNQNVVNLEAWELETYFEMLEQYDIKYGFQMGSGYRNSDYFAVRSAIKQIVADATESGTVTKEEAIGWLPNGGRSVLDSYCLWVAIDTQTGEAVDRGKGTATPKDNNMIFTAEIEVPKPGNYKVYFTPWNSTDFNNVVDPFKEREYVESTYEMFANGFRAGDNFRCFIDILSNESGFTNWVEAIRLTGGKSHDIYVEWLKERYGTIEKLNESWGMIDAAESFDVAADLIPVYTEEPGKNNITIAMDMNTEQLYRCDVRKGILWDDYVEFREDAFNELNNTISDILTATQNTDVPVVIKHISICEDYFVNKNTVGGFDGLGGEIYGDLETSTAKRTYPYSEAEQSAKTMWLTITECNTEEDTALKTKNNDVCYPSKEYMHTFFDQHMADGMKGIYDFLVYGDFFATLPVYSYHSKPEMYDWSKEYREKVEKNAWKIATTHRGNGEKESYLYPASQSWWYHPTKRNAATYSDDYALTRVLDWENYSIIPTFDPKVDKNILFINLENSPASKRFGPQLNEYLADIPEDEKVVYLGVRKDLGEIPVIDRYFTEETVAVGDDYIQVLNPTETSEILGEVDGKPYALRDGNIYILAHSGWKMYESPRGGQFESIEPEVIKVLGLSSGAKQVCMNPCRSMKCSGC